MTYYIYILTNSHNTVLYTGITNDLERRVYEHKNHLFKGFTHKYNCEKLAYFEDYNDINQAIAREKQIKGFTRKKKEDLINSINPDWTDLSSDWEW